MPASERHLHLRAQRDETGGTAGATGRYLGGAMRWLFATVTVVVVGALIGYTIYRTTDGDGTSSSEAETAETSAEDVARYSDRRRTRDPLA